MGWFDRKKDKKSTPISADIKQTTDDKLQVEYEQIMREAKEEDRAAEARLEEEVRHTVEMSGQFSQLDNSLGHRKSVELASEKAKELYRGLGIADIKKYTEFRAVCEKIKVVTSRNSIENNISENPTRMKEMFRKYNIIAEIVGIENPDNLLKVFELEDAMRRSSNPAVAMDGFIQKNKGDRNNTATIWDLYKSAGYAEVIGLVDSFDQTFSSMFSPQMEDNIDYAVGYPLTIYPNKANINLSVDVLKRKTSQRISGISDISKKGIDKGVGTEEVQQAKSTIRTAMLDRDPNKEDRNAK